MSHVPFVPRGNPQVSAYIVSKDAGRVLDFITQVFDATILRKKLGPNNAVMHSEVKIGDSVVMAGTSDKEFPAMLYVYVPDVDATFKKAVAAGAEVDSEPQTMYYGDRHASVKDFMGNHWYIATHVEDVSDEEIDRRSAEFKKKAEAEAAADNSSKKRKCEDSSKSEEKEAEEPKPKLHTSALGASMGYNVVYVSEMKRSVDFYKNLFGFDLRGKQWDEWVEFDTGNTSLAIHLAKKEQGKFEQPKGTCAPSWFVKDMDAFHKRAIDAGVKVVTPPEAQHWGGKMAAYADPDGLVFSVVESP